jgi:hypothetical protein
MKTPHGKHRRQKTEKKPTIFNIPFQAQSVSESVKEKDGQNEGMKEFTVSYKLFVSGSLWLSDLAGRWILSKRARNRERASESARRIDHSQKQN